MHSEISKKKIFLDFLDMIYAKQKALTPHTYVQGTTHLDALHQVEPIARLRPRIFFIIDELMSQCWHHMAYHVGAMPHRNEFMHMKILIMSGFVSYGSSLMGSIKT
jgi:hypothetical protein